MGLFIAEAVSHIFKCGRFLCSFGIFVDSTMVLPKSLLVLFVIVGALHVSHASENDIEIDGSVKGLSLFSIVSAERSKI